jgi:hypothetical protein
MKMGQTVCSETLAYKIQMPGKFPEERIQHSKHGESLKSRKILSHVETRVFQFTEFIGWGPGQLSSWPAL